MLEEIKKRMESCTDTYADNAEFLDDMKWLVQELDKLQQENERYKEALTRIVNYPKGLALTYVTEIKNIALNELMRNEKIED